MSKNMNWIESALGSRLFVTINQATNQVITNVDETINSIQAVSNKLTDCMKSMHPGECVIRFTLPE